MSAFPTEWAKIWSALETLVFYTGGEYWRPCQRLPAADKSQWPERCHRPTESWVQETKTHHRSVSGDLITFLMMHRSIIEIHRKNHHHLGSLIFSLKRRHENRWENGVFGWSLNRRILILNGVSRKKLNLEQTKPSAAKKQEGLMESCTCSRHRRGGPLLQAGGGGITWLRDALGLYTESPKTCRHKFLLLQEN